MRLTPNVEQLMGSLSSIGLGHLAALQQSLIQLRDEDDIRAFLLALQHSLPGAPPLILARVDAEEDARDAVIEINLGWDERWLRIYKEHAFHRVDPVIRAVPGAAVVWSRLILGGVRPSPELKRFQNACRAHGMTHGLSYVAVVRGGHKIVISLVGRELEESMSIRQLLGKLLPSIADAAARALAPSVSLAKLSPREREIFRLVIAEGMTYHQAGDALSLSYSTVKHHMQKVLKRSGYNTYAQLAWRWREQYI
ncbi:hypothetical protein B0T40_09695 [Chromobacterium haemolyticum]|uniref:helix-turn-helix transcriptional regulator n=1 Tax=Chromobacterium haemolyticum TaxID=394935 RepID=UPI0009DAA52B|nr:LuxR family transcriptional regulator [Chromobacterium haemolyticum]OQS36658.1 hypothetical protein B0T40_09695 [Chromobacterium haemolyticum]